MKLYLARHAQTNYNLHHLCNSDPNVDVHLTEEGIEQARNLAESLKDADFEMIFISQLPRTKQTADIVNAHHNKPMEIDARINDNRTGYEGRTASEYLAALEATEDMWTAKLNDGESLQEVAMRVRDFIEDLRSRPHSSVFVVTHGHIIETIFGYLENKSREEAAAFIIPQGTYAEFEI